MEDGGGAGQNKADLPRYLTEQKKTERERHGTCKQAMRQRDSGGTDKTKSAEGRRSPEESLHHAAIDASPQRWL